MLAVLTLALSVVPVLAAEAAPQEPQEKKPAQQAQAAAVQPTEVERESWRKMILRTPRPKKGEGCFVATYPETEWREVPCKTPPHKPYPPKGHGLIIRSDIVGGAGPDFSAQVTGHISEGEGSFDSVSGVTSESSPNGQNSYSLQLNTEFFPTTTCSTYALCRGWEQFVYSSSGSGFIQYWYIQYGPAGTLCPAPISPSCNGSSVFSDGWCPFCYYGHHGRLLREERSELRLATC